MPTSRLANAQRRPGFTLFELLIVVGIVSLLLAIAIVVGTSVQANARKSLATETIRVLDAVLSEAQSTRDALPPPTVNQPGNTNRTQVILDGLGDGQPMDTVAWFLLQVGNNEKVTAVVRGIPPRFLQPAAKPAGTALPTDFVGFNTVVDPWGRPFRYVHPALDGVFTATNAVDVLNTPPASRQYTPASMVRDATNSDAGSCVNGQPYFYSAGADGNPGTIDDNAYGSKPQFFGD